MAAEVDEILHAADRAASLTRQLLAFSRKQVLQPMALDLNDVVGSVSRMARRLIGTDVQLRLELGDRRVAGARRSRRRSNRCCSTWSSTPATPCRRAARSRCGPRTCDSRPARPSVAEPGSRPAPTCCSRSATTASAWTRRRRRASSSRSSPPRRPGAAPASGLSTVYGIVRQTGGAITVDQRARPGRHFRGLFAGRDGRAA